MVKHKKNFSFSFLPFINWNSGVPLILYPFFVNNIMYPLFYIAIFCCIIISPYFVNYITCSLFCTIFGFWNNKIRGTLQQQQFLTRFLLLSRTSSEIVQKTIIIMLIWVVKTPYKLVSSSLVKEKYLCRKQLALY